MTDSVRRALLVILVVAVLAGVGLADAGRGGSSASVTAATSDVASASGVGVPRPAAESSAWFCAGGTGTGGNAQSTIVLTNPAPRPVTGTVTTMAAGSTPGTTAGTPPTRVIVPAHGQIALAQGSGLTGGAVASTIVLDGGGVGATQVVTGPLGYSAAPCASTMSGRWYFADGSTAGNDTLSLSLLNPGLTTAVVDVTFVSSTDGYLAPPAYQGIDVPAQSLVVENVGDHVRNATDVATMVTSLSGVVVAAQLESAGQPGSGGPSVMLGTVQPSPTWSFAQNVSIAGGGTVFHLFNPTGRPVRVTLRIGLQQGAAEPLVIRVPALSISVLDAAKVTRIPSSTPFSATFTSAGGAGVVVSRSVSSTAGAPAPQLGAVVGQPGAGDRWLLPAPSSPATGVTAVTIVDQGSAPVTVRLMALTAAGLVPVPGFGRRRVGTGTPLVVSPGAAPAVGAAPLELISTGPVAVEVDATPAGSPGVVVIPSLPLP